MRGRRYLLIVLVGLLWAQGGIGERPARAARTRSKEFTEREKKAEELLRRARRHELMGYVLAGIGISVILLSIPISIYMKRRKQARKRAQALDQEQSQGNVEPNQYQ